MSDPYEQNRQVEAQQYAPVPAPARTSGLAIASLVIGIVNIVLGLGLTLITPIIGAVLGHIAMGSIKKQPELQGNGLAVAGVILNWLCLAGWIIIFLFFGGLAIIGIGAAASGSGGITPTP